MINFRYHVVSLIAVFLSLAIGVIMGSAVIDRAIVNRLEDQQTSLQHRLDSIEKSNDALRAENGDLRGAANLLAEQGSQRLLAGSLTGVPVAVIASRGVESSGLSALVSLLATSGADQRGTIWLTERFALASDGERRDLAAALGAPVSTSASDLRTLALTRLSSMLRDEAGPSRITDPSVSSTTTTTSGTAADALATAAVFSALRDAGFVDFDPPKGQPGSAGPQLARGTRLVFVSGAKAKVPDDQVAVPFADLLVADRPGVPSVALLAAEDRGTTTTTTKPAPEFVVALRRDNGVADRLSTVDNIGDFAGRLAAVLAIVDLGEGRVGHFGRGPGAQRLLPALPGP
ncbi:MAG: hypothetical protein QOI47_1541 [Actinomycetota bacterium]|nr:hypothetical protein [Actinomycetota bacterium]